MTIFPSFTSALFGLQRGEVTQEQLDTGLFFFGCSRGHAANPGALGEYSELRSVVRNVGEEKANEIHQQLWAAIVKAESEDRAVWSATSHCQDRWQSLFDLVNTHTDVTVSHEFAEEAVDFYDHNLYCYPSVCDIFRPLGFKVVF